MEPMGLYMVNERSGKMGEAVHPFGPGGEGGRDDAIYSSPANLQVRLSDCCAAFVRWVRFDRLCCGRRCMLCSASAVDSAAAAFFFFFLS